MSKVDILSLLLQQILISIFVGIMTRPLLGFTVFLSINLILYFIEFGIYYAKKN